MRQNKYEYDAFISHAVEDKIPIANELCAKLERAGLKIWYSGKELGIGDSIEKTIEKGLNRSRYGIVIFSPTYLAKNWTIREFYTLLAKEIEEQKVILPVLYNISLDELKNKDLLMADRFAVNADKGIDFVVERLVREIRKSRIAEPKVAWFSRIWLVLILSLLANVGFLIKDAISSKTLEVTSLQSSFDSSADGPLFSKTILGQMEGLLKHANATCSCHHERDFPSGQYKNVTFADEPRAISLPALPDRTNEQEDMILRENSGRKVTMSVVFQIETSGPTRPDIEQKMNRIRDKRRSGGDERPFIAVSNPEPQRESFHATCSRSEDIAD